MIKEKNQLKEKTVTVSVISLETVVF